MEFTQKHLSNQGVANVSTTLTTLSTVEHNGLVNIRQNINGVHINAPNQSLEAALSSIFPGQQEETQLHKARQIMGSAVDTLTDEELRTSLTEFQYILNTWFDQFEKDIFNNNTLQQLLKEE